LPLLLTLLLLLLAHWDLIMSLPLLLHMVTPLPRHHEVHLLTQLHLMHQLGDAMVHSLVITILMFVHD
jgi:hypothetical protein